VGVIARCRSVIMRQQSIHMPGFDAPAVQFVLLLLWCW